MAVSNKKEGLILLFGDLVCFGAALWLMLLVRYGEAPSLDLWYTHLRPFSILFACFVTVFFIAGLYERYALLLTGKLPMRLLRAQLVNAVIAVAFFYFVPVVSITPKTNLFIYISLATVLIFLWRLYGRERLSAVRRHDALLIAEGEEMRELLEEVNGNDHYSIRFASSIDLKQYAGGNLHADVINRVFADGIAVIVADFRHPKVAFILPHLYNLIFSKIRFIDIHRVYEDVFDRVPLSLLEHSWFLENVSMPDSSYEAFRRVLDVALASVAGILSLLAYLFVFIAIKLDDGGNIFITQSRVGRNNQLIKVTKFRSMSGNDDGDYGPSGKTKLQVTSVGAFLRNWRIDELPQLWNVVIGELSLVGPRPEFPALVAQYEKEIPYYGVRHLVNPGLSGWAQVHHERHPHHGVAVDATREKLSYDLYYIKNRSLLLDLKIILKTIKLLLSRSGI